MKNIKRISISLALIFMIALCPLIMFACGNSEPELSLYQSFKTQYLLGESLNVSDGIIKYTAEGKDNFIPIEKEMISGFSTETVGKKQMVLTYKDSTLLIDYRVIEGTTLTLKTPFKTQYCFGESLNLTGGTLRYTENGEELIVPITNNMVTGFTSDSFGKREMTISYNNLEVKVEYQILEFEELLQDGEIYYSTGSIEINGNEQRYSMFFMFNFSDKTVKYTSAEGDVDPVKLFEQYYMKAGYESKIVSGKFQVTIKLSEADQNAMDLVLENIQKDSFEITNEIGSSDEKVTLSFNLYKR